MTRLEQLTNWLGNRQRIYADGIALFNCLAKPAMKEKFEKYLSSAPENPHAFDPHFTQLVNSLTRIEREAKEAPSLYPSAMDEVIVAKKLSEPDRKIELEARNNTIASLQNEITELTERLASLESDADANADEISELQSTFDEKMTELTTLRSEVDALKQPGVKIVTEESLTPSLRKAYERIKEITPLYASLHADIANSDIPAEERKPLAEELCKLDDERRKLWKQIDDWSEGKGKIDLTEQRPAYSDNSIVRGIEIARQIKRLKQNITNSQAAADKAEKDGRKVVQENALARIAGYKQELATLEAEIAEKQEKQGENVSG